MGWPRSDDEDGCDHEPEVFEQDPDGNPTVRCRCGVVVEHMLVDGEDVQTEEAADTEREELADTEPSPEEVDRWLDDGGFE